MTGDVQTHQKIQNTSPKQQKKSILMGLGFFCKLFCAVIFKSLENTKLISLCKQMKQFEELHCKCSYREKDQVAVCYQSLLSVDNSAQQ